METNTLKYNNYIVTFIDIMGFRNLIENRYKGNAAPIYDIIKEIGETNKVCGKYVTSGGQEKEVTYHAFSDSIVRRIYIEGKSGEHVMKTLSFEMFQLALLQTYLIEKGIFIRGCINIGPLYAREGIFFGEAFNEAYKYETEVAINPLIVLSQNVVKSIQAYSPFQSDDILSLFSNQEMKYNHSHYYINYLHMIENMFFYRAPEEIATFMTFHKKYIVEELQRNSDNVQVFMKYLWLKEFHNHYVPRFAEITGRNDLLIQ